MFTSKLKRRPTETLKFKSVLGRRNQGQESPKAIATPNICDVINNLSTLYEVCFIRVDYGSISLHAHCLAMAWGCMHAQDVMATLI